MPPASPLRIAIVGSGPAGLMAATECARAGHAVELFERRPGFGRKLLVAGSSGLNVSHDLPLAEFAGHYASPSAPGFFRERLAEFPVERWIEFLHSLGQETFVGTSGRYFVREMKSSGLLKAWTESLARAGVALHRGSELADFACADGVVRLRFGGDGEGGEGGAGSEAREFDRAGFFLGGGSWEESEPSWVGLFRGKGIPFSAFAAANVGYEVGWPPGLLAEATREPVKNAVLSTARGEKAGELMVTEYGLEGTPVYFVGCAGEARLDLKPGLSEAEVARALGRGTENLSPIRRAKKYLRLSPAAFALLFHLTTEGERAGIESLARSVKSLRVRLERPRPLAEAISSSGGVRMGALDRNLGLRGFPGIHLGGEMLDWEAPTGGFLIQGCVLQGYLAGRAMAGN